jgi:predicted transcriptional regulator
MATGGAMDPEFTLLGERELDVMAVLWAIGSGTVTEVRERLDVPLAYTTVLTILRNLEAKQYVSRAEEGRAHRYFPRVAQQTAQRGALSRLVTSFFGGSPEALVARLVEEEQLSAEELARIARTLTTAGRGPVAGSAPGTVGSPRSAAEPVPGTVGSPRRAADPSLGSPGGASPYREEGET